MRQAKRMLTLLVLLLAAVMLLGACGKKTMQGDGSAEEAVTTSEFIDIEGGASMDEATMLQTNTRYHGQYVEGEYWVSFQTGDVEDITYAVTTLNRSVGSDWICTTLYDQNSNKIKSADSNSRNFGWQEVSVAYDDGKASTGLVEGLEPNTTYYLCMTADNAVDFSLCITDPSQPPAKELTREVLSEDQDLVSAANQEDAQLLNVNGKYHGKYESGNAWFAFQTGSETDERYSVTLENVKVGSDYIVAMLYDEAGNKIGPVETNFRQLGWHEVATAYEDGKASTGWIEELDANTTYFLCLTCDSKTEYYLTIGGPNQKADADPAGSTGVEGNLHQDGTVMPGTNQSSAVHVPLDTKVFGHYTGEGGWLAFTTTDQEEARYAITIINCTENSECIVAKLYDAYGTQIKPSETNFRQLGWGEVSAAYEDGKASTGWLDGLNANTTYKVQLESDGKAAYSLCVTASGGTESGYATSSNLAEAQTALDENAPLEAGSNQNDAMLLKTDTQYRGSYTGGYAWFAFRTGIESGQRYSITLENTKVGTEQIVAKLYDAYGTQIGPVDTNFRQLGWHEVATAYEDGKASTGWVDSLDANTLYYICLTSDGETTFNLQINAPEQQSINTTVQEQAEEPNLILAQPFELNETQVNFVANEAVYLYPEQAKAALQPLAELILSRPDRKVLLAGTTAKVKGDQASSAVLSEKRAQAVKDTLVKDFGVPESQLIVVGLGFEKDPFVRGQEWDSNGNFVETEAAKNRRVVVLDADSDTGKQILAG